MFEIWKDIPGYEGIYRVSNLGNIYSVRGKKNLSPTKNTTYCTVTLSVNGKAKLYGVHRLVAMAFLPNPDNKPQVNHKDCDHMNNRAENLEWVTRDENYTHYLNSEKFQKIHKAKQLHYFHKQGSNIREYDLLPHTGTARNVETGEIRSVRSLQEDGYVMTCKLLVDGW